MDIRCSWLTRMDMYVSIFVCLLCSFSQSLLGILYVSFPYLIGCCIGVFLSIFFVICFKDSYIHRFQLLLSFFMLQQIASIWAIFYWFKMEYQLSFILVNSFFLFTGTIGAYMSYCYSEVIRQPMIVSSV
jgi:hypothetical protein